MIDTGHHEQDDRVRVIFTDGFEDSVVISRTQHRADLRIGPTVVREQFSAVIEEGLQIGIAPEYIFTPLPDLFARSTSVETFMV